MIVYFKCNYCGNKWQNSYWNNEVVRTIKCPHCGDSKPEASTKPQHAPIDYYAGAPAFEHDEDPYQGQYD